MEFKRKSNVLVSTVNSSLFGGLGANLLRLPFTYLFGLRPGAGTVVPLPAVRPSCSPPEIGSPNRLCEQIYPAGGGGGPELPLDDGAGTKNCAEFDPHDLVWPSGKDAETLIV